MHPPDDVNMSVLAEPVSREGCWSPAAVEEDRQAAPP